MLPFRGVGGVRAGCGSLDVGGSRRLSSGLHVDVGKAGYLLTAPEIKNGHTPVVQLIHLRHVIKIIHIGPAFVLNAEPDNCQDPIVIVGGRKTAICLPERV